jgi:3-isopropylmalate dehydrogenase
MLDELRGFDAIFLGAIGHPDVKPGLEQLSYLPIRLNWIRYQFASRQVYPNVIPGKKQSPQEMICDYP